MKRWRYEGPIDYPPKVSMAEGEFITVEKGQIALTFYKTKTPQKPVRIEVAEGNYLMLGSGLTKTVEVLAAPASGLTLRWPSGKH